MSKQTEEIWRVSVNITSYFAVDSIVHRNHWPTARVTARLFGKQLFLNFVNSNFRIFSAIPTFNCPFHYFRHFRMPLERHLTPQMTSRQWRPPHGSYTIELDSEEDGENPPESVPLRRRDTKKCQAAAHPKKSSADSNVATSSPFGQDSPPSKAGLLLLHSIKHYDRSSRLPELTLVSSFKRAPRKTTPTH